MWDYSLCMGVQQMSTAWVMGVNVKTLVVQIQYKLIL